MRFPVNPVLPLSALILLGAATGLSGADRIAAADLPVSGPAADYPVVVGEPFVIEGTVWTPVDQLNYDAVGQALVGAGTGVTGAHKTLPLPCYVEVTALDSGRTVLVRIERRGPMTNDALVELSAEVASQLGIASSGSAPVRVRRVNPPEQERALLRAGGRAPERMETPEGLLKVLRRKLADQSPLLPTATTVPAAPAKAGTPPSEPLLTPAIPATPAAPKPSAPSASAPAPDSRRPSGTKAPSAPTARAETPARGSLLVQVAAFSIEASARKVARELGGSVEHGGKFWRVRLGPYTNRAQAARALEKAKGAGYSDARIQNAE